MTWSSMTSRSASILQGGREGGRGGKHILQGDEAYWGKACCKGCKHTAEGKGKHTAGAGGGGARIPHGEQTYCRQGKSAAGVVLDTAVVGTKIPCAVLCCAVLQNTFPDLMQYVRIRVVEMLDHVLATYNPRAGEYTEKLWKRAGEAQLPHKLLVSEGSS